MLAIGKSKQIKSFKKILKEGNYEQAIVFKKKYRLAEKDIENAEIKFLTTKVVEHVQSGEFDHAFKLLLKHYAEIHAYDDYKKIVETLTKAGYINDAIKVIKVSSIDYSWFAKILTEVGYTQQAYEFMRNAKDRGEDVPQDLLKFIESAIMGWDKQTTRFEKVDLEIRRKQLTDQVKEEIQKPIRKKRIKYAPSIATTDDIERCHVGRAKLGKVGSLTDLGIKQALLGDIKGTKETLKYAASTANSISINDYGDYTASSEGFGFATIWANPDKMAQSDKGEALEFVRKTNEHICLIENLLKTLPIKYKNDGVDGFVGYCVEMGNIRKAIKTLKKLDFEKLDIFKAVRDKIIIIENCELLKKDIKSLALWVIPKKSWDGDEEKLYENTLLEFALLISRFINNQKIHQESFLVPFIWKLKQITYDEKALDWAPSGREFSEFIDKVPIEKIVAMIEELVKRAHHQKAMKIAESLTNKKAEEVLGFQIKRFLSSLFPDSWDGERENEYSISACGPATPILKVLEHYLIGNTTVLDGGYTIHRCGKHPKKAYKFRDEIKENIKLVISKNAEKIAENLLDKEGREFLIKIIIDKQHAKWLLEDYGDGILETEITQEEINRLERSMKSWIRDYM